MVVVTVFVTGSDFSFVLYETTKLPPGDETNTESKTKKNIKRNKADDEAGIFNLGPPVLPDAAPTTGTGTGTGPGLLLWLKLLDYDGVGISSAKDGMKSVIIVVVKADVVVQPFFLSKGR